MQQSRTTKSSKKSRFHAECGAKMMHPSLETGYVIQRRSHSVIPNLLNILPNLSALLTTNGCSLLHKNFQEAFLGPWPARTLESGLSIVLLNKSRVRAGQGPRYVSWVPITEFTAQQPWVIVASNFQGSSLETKDSQRYNNCQAAV